MELTIVDNLYREFKDVIDCLDETEVSLRSIAGDAFRKNLLLAAFSHFEQEIKSCVMRIVEKNSESDVVTEFVRNKAVERQFHTYFGWGGNNANSFFGLFGQGFKSHMDRRVREEEEYRQAIRAFLELGNDRNRLVHQDFGTYPLEKTSEEIYSHYRKARLFVESLESCFDEYVQSEVASASPGVVRR